MLLKCHIVGLTGGIGAGKTEVAKILRKEQIPVFDLDYLGRQILSSNIESNGKPMQNLQKLWDRITSLLGPAVITNHCLDRKKIQLKIFENPDLKTKLEKILHPEIWRAFERESNNAIRLGAKLVVCEAALLIESGYISKMDELLVVISSEKVRKQRVLKRDSLDDALFNAINCSQVTDSIKMQHATHTIVNEGTIADLKRQTLKVIALWRKKGWL